jgi:hypothetical protein
MWRCEMFFFAHIKIEKNNFISRARENIEAEEEVTRRGKKFSFATLTSPDNAASERKSNENL